MAGWRAFVEGKVGRRHRRRRLDRRRKFATASITFGAARLLVIENSEPALHAVHRDARRQAAPAPPSRAASPTSATATRMFRLMAEFKPDIVFHAAALKHVPLLERDWDEGVKTNIFGSVNVADAAAGGRRRRDGDDLDRQGDRAGLDAGRRPSALPRCIARRSTRDLARRGQTAAAADAADLGALRQRAGVERLGGAEIQGADRGRRPGDGHASRHGALFHDHPRSLRPRRHRGQPRAGTPQRSDVSVYVLNMGQPVKIVDLAERMIRLSGLEPGRDIESFSPASRPGERLNEILFARSEPTADIGIAGVVAARPAQPSMEAMRGWLAMLDQGLAREEREAIYRVLRDAVPDFQGAAA